MLLAASCFKSLLTQRLACTSTGPGEVMSPACKCDVHVAGDAALFAPHDLALPPPPPATIRRNGQRSVTHKAAPRCLMQREKLGHEVFVGNRAKGAFNVALGFFLRTLVCFWFQEVTELETGSKLGV